MFNRQINRKKGRLSPWNRSITAAHVSELNSLPITQLSKFLISYGNALGYQLDEEGVCVGLADTLTNAFWVSLLTDKGGLVDYFQRLKIISHGVHLVTSRELLAAVEADMRAFFERIKLIQESQININDHLLSPNKHYLSPERSVAIKEILAPIDLITKDGRPMQRVNIASVIGAYTVEELNQYLSCLRDYLGAYPFEISLSCGLHTVSLCFCPTQQDWLLFDAAGALISTFNRHNQLDLAKHLMQTLSAGLSHVIFSAEIRTVDLFEEYLRKQTQFLFEDFVWKKLHEINLEKIAVQSATGFNLLMVRAYHGQTFGMQKLIDAGISIDAQNIKGSTALILAAQEGYLEIVKILIANKANVNLVNLNGNNALYLATLLGHVDCMKVLIENGAEKLEKSPKRRRCM